MRKRLVKPSDRRAKMVWIPDRLCLRYPSRRVTLTLTLTYVQPDNLTECTTFPQGIPLTPEKQTDLVHYQWPPVH